MTIQPSARQPSGLETKPAISGIGSCFPTATVDSATIELQLGVEPGWIEKRTGIVRRHRAAAGESSSALASQAILAALAAAAVDPGSIDMLICATCTADMILPSTACWTHRALGWKPIPAFDLNATCAGFLYAMELAGSLITSGQHRRIVVVAAEAMSHFLDPMDRQCAPLFGDGAAAAVVAEDGWLQLLDSRLMADGSMAELITVQAGGSKAPASTETVQAGQHFIRMNGREVFRQAVERMSSSVLAMLDKWRLHIDDISWVIPHQANARIAEAVGERLNLPASKLVIDMADIGNTSAATVPIAMERTRRKMRAGDLVLVTTFGAGATWGCQLYRVNE